MHYIWYIYFGYFGHSAAHLFVHILLMLRKFRIFFRTFTRAPVLFLSDIPDTPRTCVTFGIFISDISDIKHLIYLCMLRKFHIFFRTYTQASGLFFQPFCTVPAPQFICAHLADAMEVPHIFRTFTQAPVPPYCFEFPTSGIPQIQAKYRGISQIFS